MARKVASTEFQVRLENVDRNRTIDFTEKRLAMLGKTMPTKAERDACNTLLGLYLSGAVAVKWSAGSPRYVKLQTKAR